MEILKTFKYECDCGYDYLFVDKFLTKEFQDEFDKTVKRLATIIWETGLEDDMALQELALLTKISIPTYTAKEYYQSVKNEDEDCNTIPSRESYDFKLNFPLLEGIVHREAEQNKKEDCKNCLIISHKVSSTLNYGFYLLGNKIIDNETQSNLIQIAYKLAPFTTKYQEKNEFNSYFNHLWNLFVADKINASYLDHMTQINPNFIKIMIDRIHDDVNTLQEFDEVLLIANRDYLTLIKFAVKSKNIFQLVSEIILTNMFTLNFPNYLQTFITHFVNDVRVRLTLQEFCSFYKDDLFEIIVLLTDSNVPKYLIEMPLKDLKTSNYKDFVLLITHFKKYKYLF